MFGIADYGAFVAAIVVFMMIPGPGNLALITSTGKGGVRGGPACAAPVLQMQPRHYLRQALTIALLNPKAIMFYMAFFPLFIAPARHQGLLTFGVMAATIAALGLLYSLLAARLRANRRMSGALEKFTDLFLVGFGIKLAVQ